MKNQLAEDLDLSLPEGWYEVDLEKGPILIGFDEEVPEIDWTTVMAMVDRREWAQKHVEPCPFCDSIQVQLTQWATPTLQFKCRTCKQKFVRTIK